MPDNTPVLSAAQHAIHNLKEYRAGNTSFPGEAIGILERFVGATSTPPDNIWPNGCERTGPKALRYLASNTRPAGGESNYNSEHLLQIAGELERAFNSSMAPRPSKPSGREAMDALLASISDADLFDILKAAGRVDQLDFRVPGTSRSHKVTCAVLEDADMAKVRGALLAKGQ